MIVLVWKVLAALFALCGIAAYLVGWVALFTKSTILVSADFWFPDAPARETFAFFFLIQSLWGRPPSCQGPG